MLDFAEIRKQVAIEHNVLLDKDDAILVSVTLNELVLQRYAEILAQTSAQQNEAYRKAIEDALQKGIADAKVSASALVTEGGKYLQAQAREGLLEALKDAIEQHAIKLNNTWNRIEKSRKRTEVAAWISCTCAIITIALVINAA